MTQLCYLMIEFFIFSVAGWCMEVFLKYRQYGRFINRGFLIGPYCPIYGTGVVSITVMVKAFSGVESSVGTTFLISFIGCGILEYLVSYIMEKRFHTRWWDYSTKPMNLQGRIWIGNLILFGLGGVIIVELINPVILQMLQKIPNTMLYIISGLIVIVMLVDYIISHFVMKFVKVTVEGSEADNTEAISQEIKLLVTDKSVLYKRIADAYPDAVYRTERINQRIQEMKAELERFEQETRENWELRKQEANESLELLKINPLEIGEEIIFKQDALIKCLEEETLNPEKIQSLHNEIDDKKKMLENRKKLRLTNNIKLQLNNLGGKVE